MILCLERLRAFLCGEVELFFSLTHSGYMIYFSRGCMICFGERLHDFFVKRLCDFCVKRLRDFCV